MVQTQFGPPAQLWDPSRGPMTRADRVMCAEKNKYCQRIGTEMWVSLGLREFNHRDKKYYKIEFGLTEIASVSFADPTCAHNVIV